MPSQKAITLLLRVVLPDGRRRYLNPHKVNGKVKPQWAVNTKPTRFPDGIYALRYYLNKRVIFQSVGPDLDVALIEQRKIANRVEGILLGTVASPPAPEPGVQENRLTLREAVNKYLHEVDRNKSHETYRSYNNALEQFIASCSKTYLDDLTRDDGQAFIQAMQKHGLTNHSICLKLQILNTFLKNMERPQILKPKEWPRYTDKAVVSHSRDELTALLSAANPEEQMLYRFFLGSGFRQTEVAVAQYQDVDFGRGTVLVREKKELGFMPKSRKVRLVPLPDDLLRDLQERWLRRPSDKLIFPTASGNPQTNMLTPLKRLALKTGLNCGACVMEDGRTCRDHAICGKWTLHSFRRSFATLHHDGGVSAATLKEWLGHSSLLITQRYLEGQSATSPAARMAVNRTFAGLLPIPQAGPVLVPTTA